MYSLFVGIDVSKDSFLAAGLNEKAKLVFSAAPEMNEGRFIPSGRLSLDIEFPLKRSGGQIAQ